MIFSVTISTIYFVQDKLRATAAAVYSLICAIENSNIELSEPS